MINGLVIALLFLYPFLVYAGLDHLEPRVLAIVLVAGLLLRYAILPRERGGALWMLLVLCAFAILAAVLNSTQTLLLYPVVVNLLLLVAFSYSLWRPPTAIEYVARLAREGELSEGGVAYTRKVTWVWCGFFVANGAIAAWTASFASLEAWTLYNGFISYVAIGLMFAIEWLVRRRVKRAWHSVNDGHPDDG